MKVEKKEKERTKLRLSKREVFVAGGVLALVLVLYSLSSLFSPVKVEGKVLPEDQRPLRLCTTSSTVIVSDWGTVDGDTVLMNGALLDLRRPHPLKVGAGSLIFHGVSEGTVSPITLEIRVLETMSRYVFALREGEEVSVPVEFIDCGRLR